MLYANAALLGAVMSTQTTLTLLCHDKQVRESSGLGAPFADRQHLVGNPEQDDLENRFT